MSDEVIISTGRGGRAVVQAPAEVVLTGRQIADLLWASDNVQQADFWERLAEIEDNRGHAFGVQFHHCADKMTDSGRGIARLVADYLDPVPRDTDHEYETWKDGQEPF
jgi:hypothetical protein